MSASQSSLKELIEIVTALNQPNAKTTTGFSSESARALLAHLNMLLDIDPSEITEEMQKQLVIILSKLRDLSDNESRFDHEIGKFTKVQ